MPRYEPEFDDGARPDDADRRRLEAIRDGLRTTPPEDVTRQLPNLVETVAEASADHPDTVRLIGGVSFTKGYEPLDYRLDRVFETEHDAIRVETLKDAIDHQHFYLRVTLPPDPHFDASVLRGVLLGAVDRRLEAVESADVPASGFPGIWHDLVEGSR